MIIVINACAPHFEQQSVAISKKSPQLHWQVVATLLALVLLKVFCLPFCFIFCSLIFIAGIANNFFQVVIFTIRRSLSSASSYLISSPLSSSSSSSVSTLSPICPSLLIKSFSSCPFAKEEKNYLELLILFHFLICLQLSLLLVECVFPENIHIGNSGAKEVRERT